MAYSRMKYIAAAWLILTAGCAEQPARSAAQSRPDSDSMPAGTDVAESSGQSIASEEPLFDSLTEPEPPASSVDEVVADASYPGNRPPQLVIPTQPNISPPKKKSAAPRPSAVLESPGVESQSGKTVRRSGITQDRHGYSPEIVYFATNRDPDHGKAAENDPDLYFGGDRGSLTYGTCEVSIPYKREPGTLPEPSILRLEFSQDPAKHVVLMEIDLLPHAEFWKQLRVAVDASSEKQLLIFVHGYCATFRDAARRTAQMSYDMNYKGPAMFFSWPAGAESENFGEKANYLKDLRRAEESDEDLITVLSDISRYSGAKSIHLVAHR